jgi:hypothetical protein
MWDAVWNNEDCDRQVITAELHIDRNKYFLGWVEVLAE